MMTVTIDADIVLDGKTLTTINGDVNTDAAPNANLIGWTNGGTAIGLGGTAESTINGDTVLTIDGTDRAAHEGAYETPGADDIVPQLTTALNVMKGSKINAIGVAGGGTAMTTLGGTAESRVNGTTTIDIKNATVLGTIGGGIAGSVDATGVAEELLAPDKQLGNNDGTTGFGIGQNADGSFGILTGKDEENAIVKVQGTHVNDGGTATSTTGDTYVNINGDSTVIGAIGGGIAAASQTYTYRDNDATYTGIRSRMLMMLGARLMRRRRLAGLILLSICLTASLRAATVGARFLVLSVVLFPVSKIILRRPILWQPLTVKEAYSASSAAA